MKHICAILMAAVTLQAQPRIAGIVADADGNPLFSAAVQTDRPALGTYTDMKGRFTIEGPWTTGDSVTVRFSLIGFRTAERRVRVPAPSIAVRLEPEVLPGHEVVVTATRKGTFIKDAPTRIEVMSLERIQRHPSIDITKAIDFSPGVRVQNNCGVCGTNDIRIQGMEGQYTQVLINGHPIVSSLSSVYGLMGIATSNIRQVEIVKGPGTILFGPEAIAGTVNIITRRPTDLHAWTADISGSSRLEHKVAVAGAHRWSDLSTSLSVDYSANPTRHDDNRDGFTDIPLFTRLALLNQWEGTLGRSTSFDLYLRGYTEDRFGGEVGWDRGFRGSNTVYGESIDTRRWELLGALRHAPARDVDLEFRLSHIRHEQDSYYGVVPLHGDQRTTYGDATVRFRLSPVVIVTAGLSGRFEWYDDNTPATADPSDPSVTRPATYSVLSGFVQAEWMLTDRLQVLPGMRYNVHNIQGGFSQPRFSVRYRAGDLTTLRLSAGTGFRTVNIFTEDHAALTGSREVVLVEDLRPERSLSVSAGLVQDLDLKDQFGQFTLDVYYTRFSNQIIPDYDTDPNKILYANLTGFAVSRGAEVGFEYQFAFPARAKVAYEYLEAFKHDAAGRQELLFNPRHSIYVDASGTLAWWDLKVAVLGKWVGRQRLPSFPPPFERPTRSRPYALWNLTVSKAVESAEIYLGVENLFDVVQESPLIDPTNPFGEAFDTTYIYGPLHRRELVAGVRFSL